MHPLVLETLRARHEPEFASYLLRAADEYFEAGDCFHAAELLIAKGDGSAAAAALERLPAELLQQPSSRLIDILTAIDTSDLCVHPNLWIATLPWRRQSVDSSHLYVEGAKLLASENVSSPLQRRLRVRLAILAQEVGRLTEARALLDARGERGSFEEAPDEQRLALMTSSVIAAKQGRFADADRYIDEADAIQGTRYLRFDAERSEVAMEKARMLGDWHGALKLSEEALHAAQRSGMMPRIAGAALGVAREAWYCNDDASFAAAIQILDDCGLAAAVDSAAPVAHWRAALAATDAPRARDLCDTAIGKMDAGENEFLQIMIRVTAALLLPAARPRLLEARTIAQGLESPPLRASLELLIDSPRPADYGIFKYIAARVARSPLRAHEDVLCIDVLRGEVRRGSQLLHVSDRGLELLLALALLPAGTTKEELAAAIWPGLDGESALNSLKMCVSRTRAQLGDRQAIESTKRGYALGERVAIDVRECERLLRSVRGVEALSDALRREVEGALAAVTARERTYAAAWAWFAPQEAHLVELEREFGRMLAKETAAPGRSAAARQLARL